MSSSKSIEEISKSYIHIYIYIYKIYTHLFFFDSVFAFSEKHLWIIVFIHFKNKISLYYGEIGTTKTFFWNSIIRKIYTDVTL